MQAQIKYETDNLTLFFIDDKGNTLSATPLQGDRYYNFLDIQQRQQNAERTNNANTNDYLAKLHAFQLLIDSGRRSNEPAPNKPLQLIVEISIDSFNQITATDSSVPFPSGILPDPIYTVFGQGSTGLRNTSVPDVQLNLLLNINKKLDQIIGILGNK